MNIIPPHRITIEDLLPKPFIMDFIPTDSIRAGNDSPDFWDPIGEHIKRGTFQYENQDIEDEILLYGKTPAEILRKKQYRLLFAFLGMFGFMLLLIFIFPRVDKDWLLISILFWFPFLSMTRRIQILQADTIKKKICDQERWEYCPAIRKSKWKALSNAYPEIFRGNSPNIQDEIWGDFQHNEQKVFFWSGIFEHEAGDQNSRSSINHETLFAFPIQKKINSPFLMTTKEPVIGFLVRLFGIETIGTESIDFNKNFLVKGENSLEVVARLSPRMQELLMAFKKSEKSFTLLIEGELALFRIPGLLIKEMKTNFFESLSPHPDDTQFILERLKKMLDISTEMVVFLD